MRKVLWAYIVVVHVALLGVIVAWRIEASKSLPGLNLKAVWPDKRTPYLEVYNNDRKAISIAVDQVSGKLRGVFVRPEGTNREWYFMTDPKAPCGWVSGVFEHAVDPLIPGSPVVSAMDDEDCDGEWESRTEYDGRGLPFRSLQRAEQAWVVRGARLP